ncbi:hypothetical protein [Bacillus haynesii]|uniref:hypothetical protein n=2 Tax=Bacillus haynesii TaxID=1925021 RepID=UPI002280E8CB|nr:hypothetical protein [Bacillus haynesii]MCY9324215.1 hypothetical protein [Bacillus haynesii]
MRGRGKIRKLILFFVAVFATIGLMVPSQISAAEVHADDTAFKYTIEDYINYLANYSEEDAINGGVSPEYVSSAVFDAQNVLNQFKAMPKEDQQKFVDNLTKFDTNALTVNTEVNEEEDMIAKPQANKSVSYTDSVEFFGAPVTTYRVSVNYSVTKGKVKKINSSSAYVVRNWNPVVRTELNPGGKNAWVKGDNKAAVTGSFFYRIGPLKDFAVQLGNVHLKAVGDKNGKRTYKKTRLD